MKRILFMGALIALSHLGKAQSSGFGLGIMLGEPTGLSGKLWLSGDKALGMGLAWGGVGVPGGYLHLHGDYLFHKMDLISVSKGKLPLYFGPGVRMRIWDDNNDRENDNDGLDLGIRFPVGLAYLFDGAPIDVFLEVAPTLDLIPSSSLDVDGGIGVRYWF